MKILILSPLFPPDTGAPSSYVKELALRLQPQHAITVHIYGYLPESISGVTILSTDKRTSLLRRLLSFTRTLFLQKERFDLVLVNNAPSIELPFIFFWVFRRVPYILLESDPLVQKNKSRLYAVIHSFVTTHAHETLHVDDAVYKKAERLPFEVFDTVREENRNRWWSTHIEKIHTL